MSEPRYCEHAGLLVDEVDGRLVHLKDDTPCHGEQGRILQIIPAPGWRALHTWKQEGKATRTIAPLAALALVEYCDGGREVVGLDQGDGVFERADAYRTLSHYLGPGEEPEEEHREAQEELRLALEQRAAER